MFFFILVLALGAIGMLAGLNLLVFVFALLVAAILSGGLQSGPMMLGFQAAAESIPPVSYTHLTLPTKCWV